MPGTAKIAIVRGGELEILGFDIGAFSQIDRGVCPGPFLAESDVMRRLRTGKGATTYLATVHTGEGL
jgi:hypothetical protein